MTSPIQVVLSRLAKVKKVGDGWVACCPAHDDDKPSLSVGIGHDGRVLLHCQAGCKFSNVLARLGMTSRDLVSAGNVQQEAATFKPKAVGKVYPTLSAAVDALACRHGRPTTKWEYNDEAGELVGLVLRWDRDGGKDIRPVARCANGWQIGALVEPRPLYRLSDVVTAKRVVVVEGEKAADAARRLGFVATTAAGGAGAAGKTDWRPLAGKEVWLFPDNDKPGRTFAAYIAKLIPELNTATVVRIVELPGLPAKGDIVDWIESHGQTADSQKLRAEIEFLVAKAQPAAVASESFDFQPFPVDALPEPLRGFVAAAAAAIGCDPSYLALALLVVLASAIGTTRRLQVKGSWTVPAILWGAIVGDSGTAKTTAFKYILQPVWDRQRKALARHAEAVQHYEHELAHWEKEHADWKRSKRSAAVPPQKPNPPPCERCIVGDTTVEAMAPILLANPRGVLLARDELAGWLASFDRYAGKSRASADAAIWLSMFNAEAVMIDRKTGLLGTIHVPEAAVSVVGGIQPGILRRALGVEHRESGLAARLLLAYPPRRAKRWTEADVDPKAKAEIAKLINRLYELQPMASGGESQAELIRLSPEAKKVWVEYYDAHATEQVTLTGDLAAAWSKLEEYAARLALVIFLTRRAANDPTLPAEGTLDAESMSAGIRLATWFKGEARRVYALFGKKTADIDRCRLIDWIAHKGGTVTVRDVQQGCRWLKDPGTAEASLQNLVATGFGHWSDKEETSKGGRPSRRFTLNPSAAECVRPQTSDEVS